MSDTRQQTPDTNHAPDAVSTNSPQPPHGPSADKRHQLTVPTPVPSDRVHDHIVEALDSVDAESRVAVFDAAVTSDVPTTIVRCQPGTAKYILTQANADSMNSSETLSRGEVVNRLKEILTTQDRDAVGEFYTKSSIGPGAGTLSAQY